MALQSQNPAANLIRICVHLDEGHAGVHTCPGLFSELFNKLKVS